MRTRCAHGGSMLGAGGWTACAAGHILYVTLIIAMTMIFYAPQRAQPRSIMAAPDLSAHPDLRTAVLEELTAYAPAKQMHLMRHWPAGRMSLVHLNVLFVLSGEGPLPMNRLAELLDVSQASATGIVDRMEQRGLVTRERDDDDRRVVRVALSPQGDGLIAGIASQRRDHLARLIDSLAEADATALLQGLRAMRLAREALLSATPSTPNAISEATL
jgi:DNA-binding MarR family transcriptional regulator